MKGTTICWVCSLVSDPDRNGFLALARYDQAYLGGNGDGVISSQDAIFTKSKLWWDSNHNGISEPNELQSLKESGIEEISLDYRNVTGKEQYGNLIRYEADVLGANHRKIGTAYDVLLLPAQ